MQIAWTDHRPVDAGCPACGERGGKPRDFSFRAESLRALAGGDEVAMLHCPACGVRFCDPLASVDYADADERGAKFYLEAGAGLDVMLEAFAQADDRPVSRYLEIGCSFGFTLDYGRRILGWEVRGFDPGALARLGRKLLDLPIENRFFQTGQGFDDWADLVFCSEVIEHIPDPAPFLALLSSALKPDGQLILTTPNGDALSEDADPAVLSAILSPGHHIVLYNPASIAALLKRHGFGEVRVEENGFQLRVAASRGPMRGRAAWFDRGRYRRYLEALLQDAEPGTPLGDGVAYRLVKELVNGGDYAAARDVLRSVRGACQRRYGFDLGDPDAIPVPPGNLDFDGLGERWPFNLAGLLYFQGLADWLGAGQAAKAAASFAAAAHIGSACRTILRAAGVDDLELADLGRQAALAHLSVLAQFDPQAAVEALSALPADDALAVAARRRLFLDLANLGHAGPATAVMEAGGLDLDSIADPALLLAAADYGPGAELRRRFRQEVNAGEYRAARESFALMREDCLRRFAIDLADPAKIPQPGESIGLGELVRRWPPSLYALLYFYGLVLWLEESRPAKAAAYFHVAARFAAAARRIVRRQGGDDAQMADFCRQANLARLSALAQYDPQGAADALLTFTETMAQEHEGEEGAGLAAAARRRLFTDLVNLGHFKPAATVLASGGLDLAEPLCAADLPAAYAFALFKMSHLSDFAAAAADFAAVSAAARGTAAEGEFFWTARFHQGMASRLGGLGEADGIAAEMRAPAEGLLPVPPALLDRLGELTHR